MQINRTVRALLFSHRLSPLPPPPRLKRKMNSPGYSTKEKNETFTSPSRDIKKLITHTRPPLCDAWINQSLSSLSHLSCVVGANLLAVRTGGQRRHHLVEFGVPHSHLEPSAEVFEVRELEERRSSKISPLAVHPVNLFFFFFKEQKKRYGTGHEIWKGGSREGGLEEEQRNAHTCTEMWSVRG